MTGLDRREFLQVGALGAGAALLNSAQAGGRVAYGVNRNYYNQFTTAVPGTHAVRIYYDAIDVFPRQWPHALPGAWTTLSIRPVPARLLSGKLDSQLRDLLLSAPPHSELTCWHEAGPGNPLGYPHYITADAMYHVHEHMMRLCQRTHVRYGSVICGPALTRKAWIGSRLHWYGFDLYFNSLRYGITSTSTIIDNAKVLHRLDNNLRVFRELSGVRHPLLRVCETNSPYDSNRGHWFTLLSRWMAAHNGHRILTFWNPDRGKYQKGLSGPWPPSDPVVDRLNWLHRVYGR